MKQIRIGGFQKRLLLGESREILGQGANRITLILAIMVCVSPLLLFVSMSNVFEGILIPLHGAVAEACGWLLRQLLIVLFALPLWVGALSMASRAESGEEIVLAEVFDGFSGGKRYRTSLAISWSVYWRVGILAVGIRFLALVILGERGGLARGILLIIALALFGFLWSALAFRGFFGVYACLRPSPSVRKMLPYARSLAWGYLLAYLPRLLLSLLTFGVLLLADTLPSMLVAYFRLCRKLNEKTTQSEELINE
ncbi:MAG: hypothetical protein E7620_04845 [Ruminococcaceae bacterium]|nr:hypothetical protein [Oscillospiraceae bacterium]